MKPKEQTDIPVIDAKIELVSISCGPDVWLNLKYKWMREAIVEGYYERVRQKREVLNKILTERVKSGSSEYAMKLRKKSR